MKVAVREVFEVALANGVEIEPDAPGEIVAFIDKLPPEGTSSMQRDIMAGRISELNEQCGAVVRSGEQTGVETPVNRLMYHSLLPLEMRARGEINF